MSAEEQPLILPARKPLIVQELVDDEYKDMFPLLRVFFPRIWALVVLVFGRLFARTKRRPRYKITRIDRTPTGGWEIFEYEY